MKLKLESLTFIGSC